MPKAVTRSTRMHPTLSRIPRDTRRLDQHPNRETRRAEFLWIAAINGGVFTSLNGGPTARRTPLYRSTTNCSSTTNESSPSSKFVPSSARMTSEDQKSV